MLASDKRSQTPIPLTDNVAYNNLLFRETGGCIALGDSEKKRYIKEKSLDRN